MSDALQLVTALIGLITAGISAAIAIQQRRKPEAHWAPVAQPTYNPASYYQAPGSPASPDPFSFNAPGQGAGGWNPGPAPYGQPPVPLQSVKPVPLRRAEAFAGIRDGAILFAASAVLGFLVGLGAGDTEEATLNNLLGLLSIALLIVGFTASAALSYGNRWKHLAFAGLAIWLLSFINVLTHLATPGYWFLGVFLIGLCAGIGGAISYLFRRH